jgi:carbamoyl-phosphate synthase large subunit
VLRAARIGSPESVRFDGQTDVADRVADLLKRHDSVWIRALHGAGTRAALPVRTPDQAVAWIAWWTEERGLAPDQFMAAQTLPGREFAYQSLWQEGELVAGLARERLEYLYGHLTPSGQTSTPAVARTVRDSSVDDLALAAIRAIDPEPHGVFCVDIKQDANGCPCVTELNVGRFFTTSNFFAHAGLNMPDLMVRCALGERPPRLKSSPLEPDLYWVRMVDMGYALVRGEDLDAWPRSDR